MGRDSLWFVGQHSGNSLEPGDFHPFVPLRTSTTRSAGAPVNTTCFPHENCAKPICGASPLNTIFFSLPLPQAAHWPKYLRLFGNSINSKSGHSQRFQGSTSIMPVGRFAVFSAHPRTAHAPIFLVFGESLTLSSVLG